MLSCDSSFYFKIFFQQKDSGWEGGTRANAVVYAPFLTNQGVVRNQLMHVTDLFPTLLRLSGLKSYESLNIDGVDQWDMINNGGSPARKEVVNIDNILGYGALISYPYKLVNGSSGDAANDGWLASKYDGGIGQKS